MEEEDFGPDCRQICLIVLLRIVHIVVLLGWLTSLSAQSQLRNSSFESWEKVGTAEEEPAYWNGLMSGDLCLLCSFGASQRIFKDSKEKIEGRFSARVESKSTIGGIIVNGTVTTGRVIAPGASPYIGFNMTVPDNEEFNQTFTGTPDSLVFLAKYNITNNSDSALVSIFIHGFENVKDPDHESEASSVVLSIQSSFQTGGSWKRFSFPMKRLNLSQRPRFALATFSSSHKPGKGNGNAKLWVDAVEFIYNSEELSSAKE